MPKFHKVLRAAKHQCRVVVGKRSDGRKLLCLDPWRLITTDADERFCYGTKCLSGHVSHGQELTLLNPMPRRRAQ